MHSAAPTGQAGNSALAVYAAPPRLFDRLDDSSKERVTVLLSRVQALLPIEQEAFMQELLRQQEEAQQTLSSSGATRGKLVRYTGQSLQKVQARDRGYVVPRVMAADEAGQQMSRPSLTAGEQRSARFSASSAKAPPPCSLEDLVRTRGMFGDEDVAIHLEKMSLYDKLHQNIADLNDHTANTAAAAGESAAPDTTQNPTISANGTDAHSSSQMETQLTEVQHSAHTAAGDATGSRGTAPYRSNAYQAVRLAMSSPGYIAAQKPTSMATTQTGHDGVQSVLNTTGMPMSEDELREWFDELDEEGRGALSLEEFQQYMESLERDFGVSAEYAALQRDGEKLAFDGRLSFEAFAYLVLRFARM